MYRHGLRVSEAVRLRWNQVNLDEGLIDIVRAKQGIGGVHPLTGRELQMLWDHRNQRSHDNPYVFTSERGTSMTERNVRAIVTRSGRQAGIGFPVHPHMLRHACGYKLINEGRDLPTIQQYLGHASITSTAIYTALDSNRFSGLWGD